MEWSGGGPGALDKEGKLYSDELFAGGPRALITPVLAGPVCLISQGRFGEPAPHLNLAFIRLSQRTRKWRYCRFLYSFFVFLLVFVCIYKVAQKKVSHYR